MTLRTAGRVVSLTSLILLFTFGVRTQANLSFYTVALVSWLLNFFSAHTLGQVRGSQHP